MLAEHRGGSDTLRVTVVGAGSVGLVTSACLAHLGNQVTCVDKLTERIAAVNRGRAPFHEPGLDEMLSECVRADRLVASCDVADAVAASDITFLAVATPSNSDGIDLSYLLAAAEEVGRGVKRCSKYHVVAVKSTVVPGTTDTSIANLIERVSGLRRGSFGLCMNPEFLREGSAVEDFMKPDRIVIGRWDDKSGARLADLYAPFQCPKLFMSLRDAEMTKYVNNALLATLVSFSNEFATLCEATPGTDVEEVLSAVYLDRRFQIAEDKRPGILTYLRAGCGYGGSCLPKDLLAIRQYAQRQKVRATLLEAVAVVNNSRSLQIISLVERAVGRLRGSVVALLGTAFKAGTDDVRDSPSLALLELLRKNGVEVHAYDPVVRALPNVEGVQLSPSAEEALAGADAAIIATAWPEFAKLDWTRLCAVMRTPVVFDGRNVLRGMPLPKAMIYRPIGKHFDSSTWQPRL